MAKATVEIPDTVGVDGTARVVLAALQQIQRDRAASEMERVRAGGAQDAVSSRYGPDGGVLTFAEARALFDDQARLLAEEYAGDVWDRVIELAGERA